MKKKTFLFVCTVSLSLAALGGCKKHVANIAGYQDCVIQTKKNHFCLITDNKKTAPASCHIDALNRLRDKALGLKTCSSSTVEEYVSLKEQIIQAQETVKQARKDDALAAKDLRNLTEGSDSAAKEQAKDAKAITKKKLAQAIQALDNLPRLEKNN